ncbi:DMT family transporter [Heyndrickxia ginsengihumi]|uniref:Multidrug efflux SMR transporter n=1 Tax=Heyndrickxia ginsengihumi TaxID=363870 RepID=A0A0A6VCI7_9BACI|nr:multidrug efflux SMR transporter [Heyndrickxia ginsengihumi]KHD84244.1 hypothetical protein NG54_16790 [Heyndrickxia ginsengihumi]MBE6184568.1 multidrug efflux SMR transporter [Bacillus sp. (in: firmicutes)]MCM3022122.1 multidrug efflux SMR transporter [Heyndrickxia ginsengihumi]NEY18354.1 multidrug efflux SMR transporter [Heyndrickxia ginsengihumi]
MAWLYLFIAGIAEIIWAMGLKYSHGFTKLMPIVITVVFILVSFVLFAKATSTIEIGTAYAVFTGIGAAGTAIIGILFFDEEGSFVKWFFLICLFIGIIGLRFSEGNNKGE